MLIYRKTILETYYKPIKDLNIEIDKGTKKLNCLQDEYNKLKKD